MKFQTSSLAIVVLVIWGCSTNSATTSGSLVPAGSVSRDSHGVGLGRVLRPQPDGETPYGGLIKTKWADCTGTTRYGGVNGYGAIYSITTTGAYTEVHDFTQSEGEHPLGTLLYKQGYLWGSTYGNGAQFLRLDFPFDSNGQRHRRICFQRFRRKVYATRVSPRSEARITA